jgi:hypothetical protein
VRTEPRARAQVKEIGRRRDPGWALSIVLVVAVALVVIPFFLATYGVHHFQAPLGWDTPKYLWRTSLAEYLGVTHLPSHLPPPVNGSPDRPAFPVLALVFSSLLHVSRPDMAAVFPAVAAAAIGLAAGAFAAVGLRRSWWEAALVGASVGTSVVVARMAAPEAYQDNLFAAAAILAGLVAVALALRRGSGLLAPILLLGAGALLHWSFLVIVLAMLGLTAAWFLPESWRSWRAGAHAHHTPAGAIVTVCAGAAALGAVALFGVLTGAPKRPKTSVQAEREYAKKLREDLPIYRLWFTAPVAAAGGAALVARRERPAEERFALVLLAVWLGVTALALGLSWAGLAVPAHRFLAFALPFALLVALGGIAIGRLLARRSRILGVTATVLVLGFAAYLSQDFWLSNRPPTNPDVEKEVANAAAYLDNAHVPASRPIVFIVNDTANPGVDVAFFAHTIRASLPAPRIEQAYVYLGDPAAWRAHHPTIVRPVGPNRDYDGTSWRYFRAVRPLGSERPVALLLGSLNPDRRFFGPWTASHAEALKAPGVFVVRGPRFTRLFGEAPSGIGRIGLGRLAWMAAAVFAVLFVAGLGWTLALLGRRTEPFVAASLAPAVGVAALVSAGVLASRLGAGLTTTAGLRLPLAVTLAGWGAWAIRRFLIEGGPTGI